MGSKLKLARHIAPILLDGHDLSKDYIEPFCGGGNILAKVPLPAKVGNDICYYTISLLRCIRDGWVPPKEVTEELYQSVKMNKDLYDPALVGFVGYSCSYAGKFFGGYARGVTSDGRQRNFAEEQSRALVIQGRGLYDTRLTTGDYRRMSFLNGSTVYFDPPYTGSTQYVNKFDHRDFWSFANALAKTCRVFVSEYEAPNYAECVWSKPVTSSLTKDTGSKVAVEKLFRIHP